MDKDCTGYLFFNTTKMLYRSAPNRFNKKNHGDKIDTAAMNEIENRNDSVDYERDLVE
jgi:hypothetical protein